MSREKVWDNLFIKIAKNVSEMSTCTRLNVGAVLVRDKRIVSMGYNGVGPGKTHCEDIFEEKAMNSKLSHEDYFKSQDFLDEHHKFSTEHEQHAEINCLLFSAKNGIKTDRAIMYVTHSPCVHCAKAIHAAGIIEVRYLYPYERDMSGIDFLIDNDVGCTQLYE